jgi:hypothetical protein
MSKKTKERRRQSQALRESWGDPIDYSQEFGWRDVSANWGMSTIGGDSYARQDGANRPFIETDQDLQFMRAAARSVCTISPSAKCAMNNLLSYILGNGFEYTAATKRREDAEGFKELTDACNAVIEEFLESSNFYLTVESETVRRVERDGEAFLALYRKRDGIAALRFIEPEYVVEPPNARSIEDAKGLEPGEWGFGVHTALGDVQTVYGYHVQWPGSVADFDYFSAGRMVHLKINADSTIKRGLSDYYAVFQYLLDSAKLIRNTVKGAAVLAAIAMIVESAPGTSAAAAESLRSGTSFTTYREATAAGDSKQRFVQEYKPGSILRTPNATQYKGSPLSNNTMGQACVEIEQACLRIIGSNWNMPEYMISGDASNANYSSTLAAESPFVKYCERMQAFFGFGFKEVFWRVLEIAIECGRIPVGSLAELKRIVKIQAEPPIVASRNAKEETDRNKILHDDGILSSKTWSAREGLDHEQERTAGAKPVETVPPQGSVLPVDQQALPQAAETQAAMTFNGAQIAAAAGIASTVAKGEMSRSAGIGQLQILFGLTADQANEMLGNPADVIPKPQPTLPAVPVAESVDRVKLAKALLWEGYPAPPKNA